MADPPRHLSGGLFSVAIDESEETRVDGHRALDAGNVSLHPATLKDDGEALDAVAKVTRFCNAVTIRRRIRSADLHRSLHDQEGVIKVFGFKKDGRDFVLLLDRAEGSLEDVLRPKLPPQKTLSKELLSSTPPKFLVHEFFRCLESIHSYRDKNDNDVAHCNIKPANVLLKKRLRDGSYAVKLTDFECASGTESDEPFIFSHANRVALYTAPELEGPLRKIETTILDHQAADVYSAGLVAFEALVSIAHNERHLCGRHSDPHEIIFNQRKGERSSLMVEDMEELERNLIWTMTQLDPKFRISMQESSAHPFFWKTELLIRVFDTFDEAISNLDLSHPTGEDIVNTLNNSFYMVFQEKWKRYAIMEIYEKVKYSPFLVDYIRYCRNLIVPANDEELNRHYGSLPTKEKLLRDVLRNTKNLVIHIFWFAKRYLPKLEFCQDFPLNCAKAYEEQMAIKRGAVEDMENLWERVHLLENADEGEFKISSDTELETAVKQVTFNSVISEEIVEEVDESDASELSSEPVHQAESVPLDENPDDDWKPESEGDLILAARRREKAKRRLEENLKNMSLLREDEREAIERENSDLKKEIQEQNKKMLSALADEGVNRESVMAGVGESEDNQLENQSWHFVGTEEKEEGTREMEETLNVDKREEDSVEESIEFYDIPKEQLQIESNAINYREDVAEKKNEVLAEKSPKEKSGTYFSLTSFYSWQNPTSSKSG